MRKCFDKGKCFALGKEEWNFTQRNVSSASGTEREITLQKIPHTIARDFKFIADKN